MLPALGVFLMTRRNGSGLTRGASVRIEDTPLVSRGIRANGRRLFHVSLHGAQFYDLLHLLEEFARRGGPYGEIRDCVLWSEKIRAQLCAQGF